MRRKSERSLFNRRRSYTQKDEAAAFTPTAAGFKGGRAVQAFRVGDSIGELELLEEGVRQLEPNRGGLRQLEPNRGGLRQLELSRWLAASAGAQLWLGDLL